MNHGLPPFVGQAMSGRRKTVSPVVATFPILATTAWTVPRTGWYRIVVWGGGADGIGGVQSGGAGQLYIAERVLTRGQVLSVVSGAPAATSTVTLPTGEVVTALAAVGILGGSSAAKAHPGDIIVNGSNGAIGGSPGAAGPSYGDLRGGAGGTAGTGTDGRMPAAGGGTGSTLGAGGMVLINQVRLRS